MRRKITKKQIIKALETENLQPGMWETFEEGQPCAVCAVGAVLRSCRTDPNRYGWTVLHKFGGSYRIGANASLQDVEGLIQHNRWAGALSAYYEGVAKGDREKTIAFVKKRFPKELYLAEGW